jgi:hypothetical protein
MKYKSKVTLNILIVGICLLLLITSLRFVSRFIHPYQPAYLSNESKILSQTVNVIKNETGQLIKEVEIIYDFEIDSRTDVKPFKTVHARQENLSENETPRGLLPP